MASDHWIGVDLGGTKILAGLFDAEFRLKARAKPACRASLSCRSTSARGQPPSMRTRRVTRSGNRSAAWIATSPV